MNRRSFLTALAGTGALSLVPPSQIWPFRRIFLPPPPKVFMRSDLLVTPSFCYRRFSITNAVAGNVVMATLEGSADGINWAPIAGPHRMPLPNDPVFQVPVEVTIL